MLMEFLEFVGFLYYMDKVVLEERVICMFSFFGLEDYKD